MSKKMIIAIVGESVKLNEKKLTNKTLSKIITKQKLRILKMSKLLSIMMQLKLKREHALCIHVLYYYVYF